MMRSEWADVLFRTFLSFGSQFAMYVLIFVGIELLDGMVPLAIMCFVASLPLSFIYAGLLNGNLTWKSSEDLWEEYMASHGISEETMNILRERRGYKQRQPLQPSP